jgi:hypothetical protein
MRLPLQECQDVKLCRHLAKATMEVAEEPRRSLYEKVHGGTWRYMVQDPSTYADPSSRFLEQTAVANATVDASYYHVHSVIEATCMRPIRVHKKRCIIGVAGT